MILPLRLAPVFRPGRVLHAGLVLALASVPSLAARTAAAAPGEAAIELPGAGQVADVAQTSFRDGYVQRITYAGGSRSYAEISLRTAAAAGSRFGSAVSIGKPTRAGIAAELATRFPGEVMRVSTQPRRNAYGPVGLALGSDCLYAWQWIDLAPGRDSRTSEGNLFGASTERVASIRIKLCRNASATLSDLVSAVERMRLSIGAGGAEGRPRVSNRPVSQTQRARPITRAAKEPVGLSREGLKAPGAMERPDAPHRKAESAKRNAPDPGTDRSVPLQANQGAAAPRYITDSLPTPSAPVTAPRPASTNSEIDEQLSRDLPLRAYRPPP